MKRALNAEEFCQAVGVSLPTGYEILRSGRIPAVQVGKRKAWRVLEESMKKLVLPRFW